MAVVMTIQSSWILESCRSGGPSRTASLRRTWNWMRPYAKKTARRQMTGVRSAIITWLSKTCPSDWTDALPGGMRGPT